MFVLRPLANLSSCKLVTGGGEGCADCNTGEERQQPCVNLLCQPREADIPEV